MRWEEGVGKAGPLFLIVRNRNMIDVKVKLDFDRKKLRSSAKRGERRTLFYAATSIKNTARSSLKPPPKRPTSDYGREYWTKTGQRRFRRGRYSRPGNPPYVHQSGNAGLRDIRYDVDVTRGYALIGPVDHPGSSKTSSTKVTALHEFGGRTTLRPSLKTQRRRRAQGKKPVRPRSVSYSERPYMFPALKKVLPKIGQRLKRDGIFIGF